MKELITIERMARLTGVNANANMRSVLMGLQSHGFREGLTKPHRLAAYLAQISHETMSFKYDREIWGPTAAQKRYEGRKDLGNIQPGDGSKFRGHTGFHITGRYNTGEFYKWCKETTAGVVPNFLEKPELMNTDPWEGLGPIWYWSRHVLNNHADRGDFLNLTKRINGGLNGYKDRCERYVKIGLAMLNRNSLKAFQSDYGLKVDGIVGAKTMAAIHRELSQLPEVTFIGSITPPVHKSPAPSGLIAFIAAIGVAAVYFLTKG